MPKTPAPYQQRVAYYRRTMKMTLPDAARAASSDMKGKPLKSAEYPRKGKQKYTPILYGVLSAKADK